MSRKKEEQIEKWLVAMEGKEESMKRIEEWLVAEVLGETGRQIDQWGVQSHPAEHWLGILMEEVGEVARACIELDEDAMRKELIQVAAICMSWLDNIDRDKPTSKIQRALEESAQ